MLPQREWDMVCMDIGIYPYPIAQPLTEARPLTLDNGHQAFLLEEAGGNRGNRMQCFYTASLEYWFALALVSAVTDVSGQSVGGENGGRRFLLYSYNKYTTMLFEEDIDDAAALIRLIVRFAGSVKGAENCPIEIHDTTYFYSAGKKGGYEFNRLSFMFTGYTWYGGILPGLVPARKMDKLAHESHYRCEQDYKVLSIPLDPDENTKRAALLNVPPRESHRLWNYGDLSYFNSSRYRTDVRMRLLGTACSPLSEWWILPAEAVRAFCAIRTRKTRKTQKIRKG